MASPSTRPAIRARLQPIERSTPNSRVRSKNDSSVVLSTPVMAMTAARMVPPVLATPISTRVRSARP